MDGGAFPALLVAAAVLTNLAINGGMLSAIDPVLPKLERLDPVAGLQRLFALKNLLELVKSLGKLMVIASMTVFFIAGSLQALVKLPTCGLACATGVLSSLFRLLLLAAVGVFLVIGVIDIGLQRWLFLRDMRMTKSEQKRERKESEGDPLIRNQHRQHRRRSSTLRTGLRNATFVIRGPDFALATRFAPPDAMVPILVARAVEEGATQLLKEAKALGLPSAYQPALALLLTSRVKVGHMIEQSMFEGVIGCMKECNIL